MLCKPVADVTVDLSTTDVLFIRSVMIDVSMRRFIFVQSNYTDRSTVNHPSSVTCIDLNSLFKAEFDCIYTKNLCIVLSSVKRCYVDLFF